MCTSIAFSFLEVNQSWKLMNLNKQWLFTEGKADKTIESYVSDVKGFQSYLLEKLNDVPVLSRFSFVRYKEHLMKEGYSISTINKKVNSLKVYNDFLSTKGLLSESFIQLKRDRIKIAAGRRIMLRLCQRNRWSICYYTLKTETRLALETS